MPHPYKQLSDDAFWKKTFLNKNYGEIDFASNFPCLISPQTKVATAGSCFARHISRHLEMSGFNSYIEEKGHPSIDLDIRKLYGYGLFSARYGNIYTSRQLLQLLTRANGEFEPIEESWKKVDNDFIDPFRQNIQPKGFISKEELIIDRKSHLQSVLKLFKKMEVFIFTLGLTECWEDRRDGSIFSVCPGVIAGEFDKSTYSFLNLSISDVVEDMETFIAKLRAINPTVKIILTVSPVPLIATASDKHVAVATNYSKSVLRVAAEELTLSDKNVYYFPSFEIITSGPGKNMYFSPNLRDVTDDGVNHVMRTFTRHACKGGDIEIQKAIDNESIIEKVQEQEKNVCDEEFLDSD